MAEQHHELVVDAVTNPVRAVAPHVTFADDPARFRLVDEDTIKAALLYGDRVRLRSYLLDVDRFAERTLVQGRMPMWFSRLPIVWAAYTPMEVLDRYGIPRTLAPGHAEGRKWLDRIQDTGPIAEDGDDWTPADVVEVFNDFEALYPEFVSEVLQRYHTAAQGWLNLQDYSALSPAIDASLLTVSGWSGAGPGFGETEQEYVNRAGDELIAGVLQGAGDSVPLLDVGASRSLLVGEPVSSVRLASEVLRRMPEFSRATVAEILDIREELARPLVRFRGAMVGLRREVANEQESDVSELVRDYWIETIEPQLLEIEEMTNENRYLGQLTDAVTSAPNWLPEAAGLAVGFGLLEGAVQVATAVAGLFVPPLKAARQKHKQGREIGKQDFYILHRLHARD